MRENSSTFSISIKPQKMITTLPFCISFMFLLLCFIIFISHLYLGCIKFSKNIKLRVNIMNNMQKNRKKKQSLYIWANQKCLQISCDHGIYDLLWSYGTNQRHFVSKLGSEKRVLMRENSFM